MNRYESRFEQNEHGEPTIELIIKNGETTVPLQLDYESASIFTHAKKDSHLDHVFIQTPQEDEARMVGAFIWRQILPDWEDLVKSLDDRDFHHIHAPHPMPEDVEQYEASNLKRPEEVRVIEEVDDERVAQEAMADFDSEWRYFGNE